MSRHLRLVGEIVDIALGFAFQTCCLGCERLVPGKSLCEECRSFGKLEEPWCQRCGLPLTSALERCGHCLMGKWPALDRIRSAYWLNEPAKNILHRIKFGGRSELLSLFPRAPRPEGFAVMAVPLHWERKRERGFNQSAILAGNIHPGLEKLKETRAQSTLTKAERQRNLRGSFAWKSRAPAPEKILLVDDVFTTGATLTACARVLKRAGAEEVHAWTLFRAP